ncbi:hypothetical protein GCK72_010184 [Caenorhabditis remanei]|uniref:Uncharacterized protein n=1 Tax=Caenorhabditis remanei TaxID=31234 RepID=A0A6A5H4I5_CAERE|nr:hypothetical protein GCK72_010184 [Caenorhabditis remanei]KAF1761925.1 hypothetical protein GCK72_010184 [Caenorhabditis remanei]
MDSDTLAAAVKAAGAGAPNTSSGASQNSSPPAATPTTQTASTVTPTTSSTTATPFTEQAKAVLTQLVKTSKMSRSRGSGLAEKPEVQLLIDKDLFLIQSDRRTKMNPIQQLQLIRILAQFFLERVDDGHRYAYFEAIFLGRADDITLHEYRLSVMFQLVSFSIQYPVVQILNHVMGWLCQLKSEEQQKLYSDRLIDMIVEHFVRLSNEENKLNEYLHPLENTCSEFCALFVARAPLYGALSPPMIELFNRFCSRNMQFVLRHFRDTPWLGNEFAEKVFPKLVEHILSDETEDSDNLSSQVSIISIIVIFSIFITDLLLSPDYSWTKRRAGVIASAIGASTKCDEAIRKELQRLEVPEDFKPVVLMLCSEGVKNNPQGVIDAISELHLARELEQMA